MADNRKRIEGKNPGLDLIEQGGGRFSTESRNGIFYIVDQVNNQDIMRYKNKAWEFWNGSSWVEVGATNEPLTDDLSDDQGNVVYDYSAEEINLGLNTVLSGQVALSSGVATIDTTLSATDATFMLALGIDDPNADCEVAGRIFWDDSAGTYKIKILEQNTSVGNPTVNYDVVRVR